MINNSFENYLQNKHGRQYVGLDYEKWLSELDIQEVIDWAEEWGKKLKINS
jgi:hypothetical protein